MDRRRIAASSEPAVLFRAPGRRWGMLIVSVLCAVLLLPAATLFVALGVTALRADAGVPAAMMFATAALMLSIGLLAVCSTRPRFTVTTAGIEVVSLFSTRFYPWGRIRVIRIGPAFLFAPWATELVLVDGRTVRPLATSMNHAFLRGETPFAHGRDGRTPTRSTLAAIDAHQRYLRGEFGGVAGAH